MIDKILDAIEREVLTPEVVEALDAKIPQGRSAEYYKGMSYGLILSLTVMQNAGQDDAERDVAMQSLATAGMYAERKIRKAEGEQVEWPRHLDDKGDEEC